MSLLDQTRKLEQEVINRLKELEPLIFEYAQLRKIAERLGLTYTPTPAAGEGKAEPATDQGARRRGPGRAAKGAAKARAARSATARRSTAVKATGRSARGNASGAKRSGPRTPRAAARGGAAAPGQRHEQVLAVVGEHPGITVREIGERLRVDATGLYRVVKRLTDEGRLHKDGPRLYPAEPAATAPALDSGANAGPEAAGQPKSPAADEETTTSQGA